MKKILNNAFLLFLFFSCSFLNHRDKIDSGEINNSADSGIIINIDDDSVVYGPSASVKQDEGINSKKRDPVIMHVLAPGLFLTSSYIGTLKRFERDKIPVNMLAGSEFGALIAALYSKYKKTSMLEWKIFSLNQKLLKAGKIYKDNWNDILYKFIDNEFKNEKIEKYKIPLILPLYSKQYNKVIYVKKGRATTILKAQFRIDHADKLSFLPPQDLVLYSLDALKDKGADIVVGHKVLQDKISFYEDNGFLWGVYQNIRDRFNSEFNALDVVVIPDLKNINIDDSQKSTETISLSSTQAEFWALEISQKIEKWKEENND